MTPSNKLPDSWKPTVERLDYDPLAPMQDGETFLWPAAVRGEWHYDSKDMFWQLWEYLAEQAERASTNHAVSYRNFNVGATLYAVDEETYRTGVFFGANYKPRPKVPTLCAEQIALSKARARGFGKVVGLVVYGPPQLDEASGQTPQTLHPCAPCRDVLRSDPMISRDTIVITLGHEDSRLTEVHTVPELLALHNND